MFRIERLQNVEHYENAIYINVFMNVFSHLQLHSQGLGKINPQSFKVFSMGDEHKASYYHPPSPHHSTRQFHHAYFPLNSVVSSLCVHACTCGGVVVPLPSSRWCLVYLRLHHQRLPIVLLLFLLLSILSHLFSCIPRSL